MDKTHLRDLSEMSLFNKVLELPFLSRYRGSAGRSCCLIGTSGGSISTAARAAADARAAARAAAVWRRPDLRSRQGSRSLFFVSCVKVARARCSSIESTNTPRDLSEMLGVSICATLAAVTSPAAMANIGRTRG